MTDRRPPGPRDWKCEYSLDRRGVHIRPRNDLIWHDLDEDCPCGPVQSLIPIDGTDVDWVVVHHPLDRRARPTGPLVPVDAPAGGRDDGGVAA